MLGLDPAIDPAHIPEDLLPDETPEAHVHRLALEKARAVARRHEGSLVVAGDTVVVVGGRVLGKPRDAEDAVEMLMALQGRDHHVTSGLALALIGREVAGRQSTRVRFREFEEAVARAYVETGEPMDKAGAYAIQGLGAALVEGFEGDYFNVVGLPVPLLLDLLERMGYHYDFRGLSPRAQGGPAPGI